LIEQCTTEEKKGTTMLGHITTLRANLRLNYATTLGPQLEMKSRAISTLFQDLHSAGATKFFSHAPWCVTIRGPHFCASACIEQHLHDIVVCSAASPVERSQFLHIHCIDGCTCIEKKPGNIRVIVYGSAMKGGCHALASNTRLNTTSEHDLELRRLAIPCR